MLNPNTVFRKTPEGVAEITARTLPLRAELRRLMILVDGRSSISKLATFVRLPEIDSLILELQSMGLIDSTDGTAISQQATGAETGLEPTIEQFLAARGAAVRAVNDILGPSAETLALKLEKCQNARDLRTAVTEVKQSLARMLGESTGNRFLEAVRSAAKI
ncbi:MAG: hypothetical protein EAZ43_07015 [Betaproteobacteria bacterium]|nr:MAG: hypothetical protein EAZ43_07015 [Betaproteobacteria bacterium]